MEIARLILSLLLAIAVGWNVVFWILRCSVSFSLLEKLALSYIVGLGILTLQMFLYSLIGIKYSILPMILPHIFISMINGIIFMTTERTWIRPKKTEKTTFEIFLIAGILFQVCHVSFKALIRPMDSFDSIGNFAFKAKLFFMKGYIPYELFLDKSIDIQHTDYPLFIPLSETWVYLFLDRFNDLLVKALFPMFFVSILAIFYFSLKRIIGKRLSLVSTFFLATIPHFLNYATIGYADFALAMFYSASFLYLFQWMSFSRENRFLFLSAILSVLAIWTKHEGAMLSLINIFVFTFFLFFKREDISGKEIFAASFFSIVILMVIFTWFGYLDAMGLSNEFVNKETLKFSVAFRNLDRIPLVLYDYQKHIFGPKKWNISLLVFFAGLLLFLRRAFRDDFKYITFSILLAFLGYMTFYLFTPIEIRYHLQTTGSRILLHFLPVVVFWIGYLAKELSNGEVNIH